jgi:V/A-type H+-transporting ATPase subunit G/H
MQQVLAIETQATNVYETAVREAKALVDQASEDSQEILQLRRAEAQSQAEKLLQDAHAQAQEEAERILSQTAEEAERMEAMAMGRLDRAVTFVLNRVAGSE